jgi:NAD(P)-dependent dehydrogenase (short-subunit alcohol dehydrogenase family)
MALAPLRGTVALVTGASRGVGRGVALGLGEAGATVYISGRTTTEGETPTALPGTIQRTADEVTRLGGEGIAVRCDHRNDEEVAALFAQITAARGRLDILVNNVWGGYEHFYDGTEFWTEHGFWTVPLSRWDAMFRAGVRAHYVASVFAAPLMIARRSGLIVNISFSAAHQVW